MELSQCAFGRGNLLERPIKFPPAFVNAEHPSGFYEPLGLRFRIARRDLARASLASLARTYASFGLLRHSPSSVTSCAIGQPVPNAALQSIVGAGLIVHAECNAVVIAEIELREIAAQAQGTARFRRGTAL
jgi:hypothetical protein